VSSFIILLNVTFLPQIHVLLYSVLLALCAMPTEAASAGAADSVRSIRDTRPVWCVPALQDQQHQGSPGNIIVSLDRFIIKN